MLHPFVAHSMIELAKTERERGEARYGATARALRDADLEAQGTPEPRPTRARRSFLGFLPRLTGYSNSR